MALKINKVTDFPQGVTYDELQEQKEADAQFDNGVDDTIEKEIAGIGAAALPSIVPNPTGPGLGQILTELKTDDSALTSDPRALENTSTAPCRETSVIFSDAQKAKFQQLGMKAAALSSPKAMLISETPSDKRRQMSDDLKDAMRDLPIPDVTTYAEGRKVTIPSEVIAQANQVGKAKAMLILEKIVGKEMTALAVLCARTHGVTFFLKPHLWLGQCLFYEMSKPNMWDRITPDPLYENVLDEAQLTAIKNGLAILFSWQVADQLSVIARVRNIELDQAAKLMITQVCNQSVQDKLPKDYSEQYDDTASLEQLLAS